MISKRWAVRDRYNVTALPIRRATEREAIGIAKALAYHLRRDMAVSHKGLLTRWRRVYVIDTDGRVTRC